MSEIYRDRRWIMQASWRAANNDLTGLSCDIYGAVSDARPASRVRRYNLETAATPALLRRCFDSGEARSVAAWGDIDIVDEPLTAFFCSIQCPGDVILRVYDLARALRGKNMTLIGGFQSPMEKEFLDLLLRGSARVLVCPARSIENMRVPQNWRTAISESRLLILSPFASFQRRATVALATQRNHFVTALATEFLIPYAAPGGMTESLAKKQAATKKVIRTVESPTNANLLALGARIVKVDHGGSRLYNDPSR